MHAEDPVEPRLRQLGRALVDLLYPPLCLGCEERLPEGPPLPLCPACRRRLPRAEAEMVAERLARFPASPIGHALALWTFDEGGALQRLQHALKYGNRPSLGVRLGRLVGAAWAEAALPRPGLLVPVPLHRPRRLERGYNQAERLACGIAEALGVPLREGLLARTRRTRSQTALARAERWQNVEGAFTLAEPENLAGRRVLLVDDVLTTGATVIAAALPLAKAGAAVDLALLACTGD